MVSRTSSSLTGKYLLFPPVCERDMVTLRLCYYLGHADNMVTNYWKIVEDDTKNKIEACFNGVRYFETIEDKLTETFISEKVEMKEPEGIHEHNFQSPDAIYGYLYSATRVEKYECCLSESQSKSTKFMWKSSVRVMYKSTYVWTGKANDLAVSHSRSRRGKHIRQRQSKQQGKVSVIRSYLMACIWHWPSVSPRTIGIQE